MWFLYNIAIYIGKLFVVFVSLFSKRIQKWHRGQKGLFQLIERTVRPTAKHTWFHFASLGEFEQGRPVLEAYKQQFPEKRIVVTFFSPSGYEVRAHYDQADYVFYLPLDTPSNAKRFIDLINPEIVFVVKYELWHNYFKTLYRRQIPLYLVSAIFRENQLYFKWYGKPLRSTLRYVRHYFAQNRETVSLLNQIGIDQVSLTGDTRFDRVAHLALKQSSIPAIEGFVNGSPVLVIGSSWPPDEELLTGLVQHYPNWKFIVAPHVVDAMHLDELSQRFPGSVLFSKLTDTAHAGRVLLIDNIGMLSRLYRYADIAYIGGGFGVGIHNTLEAATYGVPLIFGPHYQKFQEAKDLIAAQAAFSVNNLQQLLETFGRLQDPAIRAVKGKVSYDYVQQQAGATGRIMDYLSDKF